MHDLVYRPAALSDIEGIADVIAADSPSNAMAFVAKIRENCRALKLFPQQGPARPDIGSGVRILPMMQRVVVAYRIGETTVVILRVFWGGQDYRAMMLAVPEK